MGRRMLLLAMLFPALLTAQSSFLRSNGVLRAAYLSSNPAQAIVDSANGATRGVVVDLTEALGKRLGATVRLIPARNPQAVIDAVQSGEADIGYVAYNPERAGPVEFSKPYMLVHQTFVVRDSSDIASVSNLDRTNQKLGATRGDSVALYLARTLKQASLVELTDSTSAESFEAVLEGKLDAIGANRQRLTDAIRHRQGFRVLPDNLYGVEQTIIVGKGKADALKTVNEFIDEINRSGFLQTSIERSGVIGIGLPPQRHFALEGWDLTNPIPLPDGILKTLAEDPDVQQTLRSDNLSTAQLSDRWFAATEIDLNDLHERSFLVMGIGHLLANTAPFWIFRPNLDQYEVIFKAYAHDLEIEDSQSHGYRKLKAMAASADRVFIERFEFDGRKYVPIPSQP